MQEDLKEYNFEVYTKNPETKETGWDIDYVSIIAENESEAKEILNRMKDFDVIILFNWSVPTRKIGDSVCVIDFDKIATKVGKGDILSYRSDQFSTGYKFLEKIEV